MCNIITRRMTRFYHVQVTPIPTNKTNSIVQMATSSQRTPSDVILQNPIPDDGSGFQAQIPNYFKEKPSITINDKLLPPEGILDIVKMATSFQHTPTDVIPQTHIPEDGPGFPTQHPSPINAKPSVPIDDKLIPPGGILPHMIEMPTKDTIFYGMMVPPSETNPIHSATQPTTLQVKEMVQTR